MDEAPIQLEAPSKIVTTNTTVNMRARVACFDCQGKSDGRSIREILVQVAPQRLILIHGLPQVNQLQACIHKHTKGRHKAAGLEVWQWLSTLCY